MKLSLISKTSQLLPQHQIELHNEHVVHYALALLCLP